MSQRTWIYIIILIVVLAAGGAFFWWMYKTSKITPKAEVTPTTPTFSDVPTDYWAYTQIEAVNKAGYMIGYGKPTFKPDDAAKRGVLAAVVSRAYDKKANPATPTFSDVPTTYWAYQNIEGLKAAGYMIGETETTFNPEGQATREVVAAVIARADAGGEDAVQAATVAPSGFTDIDASPFKKHIEYVKEKGFMIGVTDTEFQPTAVASRAVVAGAVARAKLGGETAVQAYTVPTSAPTFEDVPATYPFYKHIEYDNAQGYMVGYAPVGGRTFKPDEIANRATVAIVIARAVAGSDSAVPAGPATPSYSDVPPEHYAYKYIEYLKTKTIMVGYGDGTFKPETAADRTTIAVVLARAKNLSLSALPTSSFVDVPTTYEAFKEIEAVYKAGYTQGCRQDTSGLYFCPTDQLTRAVLAVFTYNAYLKTTPTSPAISPLVSPVVSPKTPTPSPTVTVTPTPTPTPVQTSTAAPSTTTTTTTPAKTGAEVPLAGGGVLGLLFLVRYLVGKKIR